MGPEERKWIQLVWHLHVRPAVCYLLVSSAFLLFLSPSLEGFFEHRQACEAGRAPRNLSPAPPPRRAGGPVAGPRGPSGAGKRRRWERSRSCSCSFFARPAQRARAGLSPGDPSPAPPGSQPLPRPHPPRDAPAPPPQPEKVGFTLARRVLSRQPCGVWSQCDA